MGTLHTISMKIFLLLGFFCGAVHMQYITMHPASLQVSYVPVFSVPMSSVPMSSVPVSSVPMSSVPVSSVPMSSVPMTSVPMSSVPIHHSALSSGYRGRMLVGSVADICDCLTCNPGTPDTLLNKCETCSCFINRPGLDPFMRLFKNCECHDGCLQPAGLKHGNYQCYDCGCDN